MKIQLVGISSPVPADEDSEFQKKYRSIQNILQFTSLDELQTQQDALKCFTQNFARICYSNKGWDDLVKEDYKSDLINKQILPSKHHSVFEHIWLNLYIEDIPKIAAMILNNEKQYVTSEKSARYTQMKDIDSEQLKLYNKWMDILIPEIDKIYLAVNDKEIAVKKLAQENARYMTSIFTPTKMAYTANLRQINFLLNVISQSQPFFLVYKGPDDLELSINIQNSLDDFYYKLSPFLIDGLEPKSCKKLSLFNSRQVKEYFGDVYSTSYLMSFAGLAQAQRHRTINYHISDGLNIGAPYGFYVPEIVNQSGNKKEWISDLEKIALNDIPQAQLVKVNESGTIEAFELKTTERICGKAQYEIMKNTVQTAEKYKQYKKEKGVEFYNRPKCLENPRDCNDACVWGPKKATSRIV